ncbi:MAG: hypothetical protein U5M50_15485 [Sphingobium sp.]|nr:hypothetical protein [Sphingobium sp.]
MRALRDIFLTMLLAFLAAPLAHAQLGGLGGKPNIDASLRAETLNPAPGTVSTRLQTTLAHGPGASVVHLAIFSPIHRRSDGLVPR